MPPSTDLVLYDGSYGKQYQPSLCDMTWSSSPFRGNSLAKVDVLGALLNSWGPNLLSTSLLGHLRTRPQNSSGFTIAINVIKAQFIFFRRRIDALEAQNDDLRHDNMMYHSDVGALESELTNLRSDYYSELFQRRQETRRSNEDKEEIKALKAEVMMQRTEIMILNDKNAQADIFIQAIVDLKLHDPVLQAAYKSVKDGSDAEEALVNAVLKASARKDSAWSRIIPAVVGPRSPENYLSALDLALKARRDLCERQNVSGFWKLKAMADSSNAGTLTPSSSQISDICEELLQEQESSKHSTSSNIQEIETPKAAPESAASGDELPSAETVTQLQAIPVVSKEVQSDSSLLHSIYSVDTRAIVTEALDTSHESDSYSVVEDDADEYLSSGNESIMSSVTIKPLHCVQSESVFDNAHDHISEPAAEDAPNTVQDAETFTKETLDRPSTPVQDKVSFTVEPSTPYKSPQPSKVSSFLPATPLRTISRTRPTISPKSPSPPTFLARSRATEEHTYTRAKHEPFVSPAKSPIRSRLSTPKYYGSKRPVLQKVKLNVPPAARGDKENFDPKDDVEVPSSHNIRRSSTKNLRKRRGVIMVERKGVDNTISVNSEPQVSSPNTVLSDSPELPVSAPDADVFSSVPGGEDLTRQVPEADEFDGCLARDASDIEQSPAPSEVAGDAEDAPIALSESQDTQVQRPAVPSPTSLVISRFVEIFSDSDLGSLEMTEDENSDSECGDIRRVQKNPPPIRHKRTIRYSDEGDDDDAHGSGCLSASISNTAVVSALASSDSNSQSVASAPRSRPATPFSKSLSWISKNKKDRGSLSTSTSGSSYTTSTASGSDGQTSKKKSKKLPLFGLGRRFGRNSASPPPTNEVDTSSDLPSRVDAAQIDASSPIPPLNEKESSPAPINSSSKSIASFWKRNNPSNDIAKENTPVTPTKIVSPSKIPKSESAQKRTPVAAPKSSFIRRLSNIPSPKPKAIPQSTPQPIPQPMHSSPTYLAPPSPGQHTKPRSHTINTVSPLPPSLSTPTPQSLMAGSTKPRSHTVNTYSPTTRSPLSRLAGNTSTDDKPTPTKASRNQPGPSLPRSLVPKPKPISSPKNFVKNTTMPLRGNKPSTKNQPPAHDMEPKPPTAAFMRPAASPATSTRRMTNSIAPLIPNWTPSASNGMTPKQCRSMFRNSLSMVVR